MYLNAGLQISMSVCCFQGCCVFEMDCEIVRWVQVEKLKGIAWTICCVVEIIKVGLVETAMLFYWHMSLLKNYY